MSIRPDDTSPASWQVHRQVLEQMDPQARVQAAIDLSDAVRELQIQGALARNPTWSRSDAVDWLIRRVIAPEFRPS
jgi:hypothetical protein